MRILFSHFYNESYLLPWWLKHHREMFDHGVLINSHSTDESVAICRELVPHWEIIESENAKFEAFLCDFEMMKHERRYPLDWKIVLNTSEFLMTKSLGDVEAYVRAHGGEAALFQGAIMADKAPEQAPDRNISLPQQKNWGAWEVDIDFKALDLIGHHAPTRSRVYHHYPIGAYHPGRHVSFLPKQTIIPTSIAHLRWYGFSPWTSEFVKRKLQIHPTRAEADIRHGWGVQHGDNADQLERRRKKFLRLSSSIKTAMANPEKTVEEAPQTAAPKPTAGYISNLLKKFRRDRSALWSPDQDFVDRIHRSYVSAIADHEQEVSVLWARVVPDTQKELHKALIKGGGELRDMLSDIKRTNLYYGVDNLCASVLSQWNGQKTDFSGPIESHICALAVHLGCTDFWNPEGGSRFPDKSRSPKLDTKTILSMLDATLPARLDFPNPFDGEVGLETDRGIISERAIPAIYYANRILECSRVTGSNKCLEIGAGMGRTAYYSWQFGVRDYTIVDLPMTLVGQACFLAATIGPQNISLHGEERHGIALLIPKDLFASDLSFGMALNTDSLTEMSHSYASRYIEFIKARCASFISINHEANDFSVKNLMTGAMRHPYPLRPGYAEEIWFRPIAAAK